MNPDIEHKWRQKLDELGTEVVKSIDPFTQKDVQPNSPARWAPPGSALPPPGGRFVDAARSFPSIDASGYDADHRLQCALQSLPLA